MSSSDKPSAIREPSRDQDRRELVSFVAEATGRCHFALERAQRLGVDPEVVQDLSQLEQRLTSLHLVLLVECSWCPKCGADLTDPARSQSGTRHCPPCRLGWQLVRRDGRLAAEAAPWPQAQAQ